MLNVPWVLNLFLAEFQVNKTREYYENKKIKMKANCLLAALFVHFYGMMQPDLNAYVLVNGWKLARAANDSLPLLLFFVNSSLLISVNL